MLEIVSTAMAMISHVGEFIGYVDGVIARHWSWLCHQWWWRTRVVENWGGGKWSSLCRCCSDVLAVDVDCKGADCWLLFRGSLSLYNIYDVSLEAVYRLVTDAQQSSP